VSRRDARTTKVPFGFIVIALVFAVGVAAFAATRKDPDAEGASATVDPVAGRSPAVPSASSSPTAVVTPPEPKGRVVIHGTGDVSLDPSYIAAFGSNGYGWAWSGLDGLFRRDDLTVINLECPATDVAAPVPKQFNFRCDPAALGVARRYGVDVVNQSNNHAYDQGPDGLVDSLRQIRKAALAPVGAGVDQRTALRAAPFDVKGWTIAVVGIDEVLDPLNEVAGPHTPGTAAGHDFSLALRAVRRAEAQADLVVVMIHWGVELDTLPRQYQIQEAHRLIGEGADIIFGGHSHRLQPMETYHGRPIFYSLGNFVWPRLSAEGSATAVAEVVVHPDGSMNGRLVPTTIVSDGHPVLR
jgi:poly-gamma-glutamate capsule biosynthesis protein CapA/YwtB (metallophosphatase superfamily)